MSMSFDSNDLFYIESNLIGERVSLFDLAVWKNGLAFKNIDFSTTGKPVIKIAELNNGISNNTAYTDKEYSDEVSLSYGDLVFSWSGNPQTSIDIYKYTLPDGWLNQHIFKVTPSLRVDKDFLFYIMKYLKPNFTKIATNKQTTGLGHVTLSDIKRISLILPELHLQKQIACILTSIDNKIELNQQQNNNLEQQAQALFKSWFVDFEPFGGKMPNDWKVGKLKDLADVSSGKRPLIKQDNKSIEFSIPLVGASCIMGYTNQTLYRNKILITGRVGTHGIIQRFHDACWPSDNTLVLISRYYEYAYQSLKTINYTGMNRGSTQPLITQTDLKNTEIIIPSIDILIKFEQISGQLMEFYEYNQQENTRLAQIRDTLLPKLMSGKIDVSNVNISADISSFTEN